MNLDMTTLMALKRHKSDIEDLKLVEKYDVTNGSILVGGPNNTIQSLGDFQYDEGQFVMGTQPVGLSAFPNRLWVVSSQALGSAATNYVYPVEFAYQTGNGTYQRLQFTGYRNTAAVDASGSGWRLQHVYSNVGTTGGVSLMDFGLDSTAAPFIRWILNGTTKLQLDTAVGGIWVPQIDSRFGPGPTYAGWQTGTIVLAENVGRRAMIQFHNNTSQECSLSLATSDRFLELRDSQGTGAGMAFMSNNGAVRNVTINGGTGQIAIGMAPSSYQLQLSNDSAAKPGTSTWSVISDSRTKMEGSVTPFVGGIEIIRQLRPVNYMYNGQYGTPAGVPQVGLIADEAQTVFPQMVETKKMPDGQLYKFVQNHYLTYMLINAATDNAERNDQQDIRLANLEKKQGTKSTAQLEAELAAANAKIAVLETDNTTQKAQIAALSADVTKLKSQMGTVLGRLGLGGLL